MQILNPEKLLLQLAIIFLNQINSILVKWKNRNSF